MVAGLIQENVFLRQANLRDCNSGLHRHLAAYLTQRKKKTFEKSSSLVQTFTHCHV